MRAARLSSLALLLIATALPAATSQDAAFDPVAGTYPYIQPDDAGDAVAEGNPKFGDITSFSMITLADGSVLLQMKFVDLAGATGDLRYCAFFTVDGNAFQAGLRGRFVNGAADSTVAVTSCSWGDLGTTVGTPTLDTANDQVRIAIAAAEIENLAPGALFESIDVQIGAVVPGVGQGDPALFDALTPTVEPVDFAYMAGGPVDALLALDITWAEDNASAAPGETARWVFTILNEGSAPATANLTLDGLPSGFNHTFDPNATTIAMNETANVTVAIDVPMDADAATIPLTLTVAAGETTSIVNFELMVIAPAVVVDAPANTTATNETGAALTASDAEGTPGPGLVGVATVVAAAVLVARRRRA